MRKAVAITAVLSLLAWLSVFLAWAMDYPLQAQQRSVWTMRLGGFDIDVQRTEFNCIYVTSGTRVGSGGGIAVVKHYGGGC